MLDQFILLSDALAQMRQTDERGRPVPFSLEVTTCDEQRDTGGQNLVLTNWVLVHQKAPKARLSRTTAPTAQNELADQTRLVKNPANDEIRRIHIRLITSFNSQPILW